MCAALPAGQYQVLSASSPAHAVAACANNKIAAVVLDSEFLTEGGIRSLRPSRPSIPICQSFYWNWGIMDTFQRR